MPVNDYNIERLTGRICEDIPSCADCPLYPFKFPTEERVEDINPVFWCDDVVGAEAEATATLAFQELLKNHPELRKNFTAEDIREIGVMKGTIL